MAFRRAWPCHPELGEENRRVLTAHHTLSSKIDNIASIAASINEPLIKEQLEEELRALKLCADDVGSYLSFQIPPEFYNERRTNDESIVASQVFSIPELLELILKYVGISDIVNFCQVNQSVRSIIESSSPLQLKLCHQAANREDFKKGDYKSAFSMSSSSRFYPGFDVKIYSQPIFSSTKRTRNTLMYNHIQSRQAVVQNPVVTARFNNLRTKNDLPKIGTMWRKMFICQPTIQEMKAQLKCSLHGRQPDLYVDLFSKAGLTVGDLYDTTASILGSNVACDSCEQGLPADQSRLSNYSGQIENKDAILSVWFESTEEVP